MSTLVLLQWCKDNRIWIDPRLRLHYEDDTGTGVSSKDLDIPPLASRKRCQLFTLFHAQLKTPPSCTYTQGLCPFGKVTLFIKATCTLVWT